MQQRAVCLIHRDLLWAVYCAAMHGAVPTCKTKWHQKWRHFTLQSVVASYGCAEKESFRDGNGEA